MKDLLTLLMLICGALAILAFFGFVKAVLDYAHYHNTSWRKELPKCKHTFNTDEVINLKIDPKCTKCGTPLSQAN